MGERDCAHCTFWEPPDTDDISWRRMFGRCARTPHSEDVGEWRDEGDDYLWKLSPDYADRTAIVQDASGYYAALLTLPTHFCGMFRPTPPDED